MQGRAFLVSFLATEKRNSPGKAKQAISTKLGNQPFRTVQGHNQ